MTADLDDDWGPHGRWETAYRAAPPAPAEGRRYPLAGAQAAAETALTYAFAVGISAALLGPIAAACWIIERLIG